MPETELMTWLGVGFLLGLQHALDSDHLAAVSTVIAERPSVLASGAVGLWWGSGHTLVLLVVGSIVLTWGLRIPVEYEAVAEACVALLLIVLGGMLARKLYRERWHMHGHHHGEELHVHLHRHQRQKSHHHRHWMADSIRPFCIGMAHGLAGSAAVLLMILATTRDVISGLLSILVFGVGSILGMMIIGMIMSGPFIYSRGSNRRLFVGMQGLASFASVSMGIWMLVKMAASVAEP